MNAAASAPAPATVSLFIDNGDGTVTNTKLGLMWSKDTLTKKCVTHEKAEKVCSELDLAGHTDWRLPTDVELFCLADRSRYNPAIDTEAFPDTKSDWYWTSTIHAAFPDFAWVVSFCSGSASGGGRGSLNGFVRAVRSVAPGQ